MQPHNRREASAWTKFRLLMWKNFVLQSRHRVQTVAEVLVPVLAMALILILRSQVEPTIEERVTYYPIRVDSMVPSERALMILGGMNLTELTIAYSPENDLLEDIVRQSMSKLLLKNIIEIFPVLLEFFPILGNVTMPDAIGTSWLNDFIANLVKVQAFNQSEDLSRIYYDENITRVVLAAVEFPDELHDAMSLPADMSYALRFPEMPRTSSFYRLGSRSWFTSMLLPPFPTPGPRQASANEGGSMPGYMNEFFIALQHSISTELISRLTGEDFHSFNMQVQRYPHPPYVSDMATQFLTFLFPMFIVLSFSYTAINTVRAVTQEKELQLKETMKIMGLPSWLHWLAWFVKQFIFLTVIAILLTVLVKVNWFETDTGYSDYAVFTSTPWSIVFFFLLLYLSCVITLCFMISGFFSKTSTAALFGGIFWILLYVPAFFLTMEESVSLPAQLVTCLSINSAMAYGFQLMITEETTGGLQWGTFFDSATDSTPRLLFGHVVLMIVFDAVLYMLIALYCEQVMPGPYGTPRKWYFLFTREFWVRDTQKKLEGVNVDYSDEVTKEADPEGHKVGVKIFNLTKVYGKNVAVNNLSLNIYEDQITVLLGHNGAGKSTTMSVLTGNTPATHGSVIVSGYDIQTQRSTARANLGFCPQHNVLFPELTIREHLYFFSRLKGMTGKELSVEIDGLIDELELSEKRDSLAGGLSGGQKRRVSVGVALCGGARTVLLDEPTSGMDPACRRALWTLLHKQKHGRSMILTTHFMDEADYLGDRVAIMAAGRLQCVGSPYFLKRHYGVGYSLVVVKSEVFDLDECTQLINKHIPAAAIKEDRGSEVTFALLNEYTSVFEELLRDLESSKTKIGYTNYGLSATTMEDVFMNAGSDTPGACDFDDATTDDSSSVDHSRNDAETYTSTDDILQGTDATVTGLKLFWQHVFAVWFKLYLVLTRSMGILMMQLFVPIILMTASLLVYNQLATYSETFNSLEFTLETGFTLTETYMTYNGTNDTSVGATAAAAYMQMFGTDRMRLVIVEGQSVDDFYYNKSLELKELAQMRTQALVGATFNDDSAIAWFSNFGYHDVAISVTYMHNALLKSILPDAKLTVYNHPLETNYEDTTNFEIVATMLAIQVSNGFGFSLCTVTAVFVMFYIKERISRAKLLQKAAGISPITLWGGAAVFDWLWCCIIGVTFIIVCLAFNVTGLNTAVELSRVYLVIIVYAAASLPLVYLLSFCFSGPSYGFAVIFFGNTLLGLTGSQIVAALRQIDVQEVPDIIDGILQFFPIYSAVTSFQKLHSVSLRKWQCLTGCDAATALLLSPPEECTIDFMCSYNNYCCLPENPYLSWSDGVGRYLVCMAASLVVFWAILMFVEYRVMQKMLRWYSVTPPELDSASLDDDVREENKLVESIDDSTLRNHNLVAKKLTKYYGKNLAVNQVSFTVGDSECFGLLGVNGAGKTTTFKMLMGDEAVSSGDAYVKGHSVRTKIKKVHENIGYCPQFDAVFPELTGRETLRMFAALRGLKPTQANAIADSLAHALGFHIHLDKQVREYSGGNRRKLSAAVALAGRGKLVFMDEPTTGVDPAAKRQVWRAIRRASRGRGVVLTSHSMEECEALCSRLTIMVNGQFQCLGSPQHLKNKFSQGYTLTVKMQEDYTNSQHMQAMKDFVNQHFINPRLMEEYQGLLTFYLPPQDMPWSAMFGAMERARNTVHVEHYTIAQTTLEQIFLQFTKYQKEADNA